MLLILGCDPAADGADGGSATAADARPPAPRDGGPDLCAYEGPLDARVPLSLRDRCIEGIVPLGFGLRWQSQAQRLARLGFGIDTADPRHLPASCPVGATSRGATLVADASGGIDETIDTPVVFFDYQVIGGREDSFRFPDGSMPRPRLARAAATIDLDRGAIEGEGIVLVDLLAAGITGATHFAVVIDGFELTTDVAQDASYPGNFSPPQGYASRGFGFAIVETERRDDTLRVRVRARFEPGTLERDALLEQGHDRAVPVASTRAIVRVLAIAADAPITTGSLERRSAFRTSGLFELGAACRIDPAEQELVIDGADGMARGIVGLTRFDVALWPAELEVGDRLREISVRVQDLDYEASSGRAAMRIDAYASNESAFPRAGIDAVLSAEVALAQIAEDVPIDVVSVAAPIASRLTRIELPMR